MSASQPESQHVKLNPDDEIDFHLADFIRDVHTDDSITLTTQKRMIKEMGSHDDEVAELAREQLIFSHMGLIAAVAYGYREELTDETTEEGSIAIMGDGKNGLMIAAWTYDGITEFSDHAATIIGKYMREGSFEESDFETDYMNMQTRPTDYLYQLVSEMPRPSRLPSTKHKLNTKSQDYLAGHLGLENLKGINLAAFSDILSEVEIKVLQKTYFAEFKTPSKQITEELGITDKEFKRHKRRAVYQLTVNLNRL